MNTTLSLETPLESSICSCKLILNQLPWYVVLGDRTQLFAQEQGFLDLFLMTNKTSARLFVENLLYGGDDGQKADFFENNGILITLLVKREKHQR